MTPAYFLLTASKTALAAEPRRGPASQAAGCGPIELTETSSGSPFLPFMNQPPPEEPPVMVQPIR